MIAALFVAAEGCYFGLANVDPWNETRDAKLYAGPWSVVAHPPCARWGRYWSGGPSARERRYLGDDGGCFASALASVRRWGGVLEHPEASHAWRAFSLFLPPKSGGWIPAGDGIGSTCCVEQGHYGHRARKATWLYACGCELPSLQWGPSLASVRLEDGFHSADERRRATKVGICQKLFSRERGATPIAFREVLIAMAESCNPEYVEMARRRIEGTAPLFVSVDNSVQDQAR